MPDFLQTMMPYMQDRAIYRYNAASVLGSYGPVARPAIPHLRKLLRDEDDMVRSAAADALGSIGSDAKEAVRDLLDLLGSSDAFVRVSSAWALWRIDPQQHEAAAAEVLAGAVTDTSSAAGSAIWVLERMGKTDLAVPRLIERAQGVQTRFSAGEPQDSWGESVWMQKWPSDRSPML